MKRLCFDLQNGYLQHLFQVNKYFKPPLELILGSEALPSVLFFQVESLITILSQPYPYSHRSPHPSSVTYISQIHSQSKDFGTPVYVFCPREARLPCPFQTQLHRVQIPRTAASPLLESTQPGNSQSSPVSHLFQ